MKTKKMAAWIIGFCFLLSVTWFSPKVSAASIYNEDGFGFSGTIHANPLQTDIQMEGYWDWPSDVNQGTMRYDGGVFDGENIWLVPNNNNHVVSINKDTGVMTSYGDWPAGFDTANFSFIGGVFDGQYIWLVPYSANQVIKIDKNTGTMAGYSDWPSGFTKSGNAFAGGVYDGQHVWLIPAKSSGSIIRVDKDTGTMTAYDNWPDSLSYEEIVYPGTAWEYTQTVYQSFFGGLFDGHHIWLVPSSASNNHVVKFNIATGEMTIYDNWPSGYNGQSLRGGAFDGQYIWMMPSASNMLMKIDKDTGEMTGYNNWPSDFSKSSDAFKGGFYDGENVWMIPNAADRLMKVNPNTGTMTGYTNWPSGITGVRKFLGAVYDGNHIWMIPNEAKQIVKVSTINQEPTVLNLAISGEAIVGVTLNGTYDYEDADGDLQGHSIVRWYRQDDANGLNAINITGSNPNQYSLIESDFGRYIRMEVTPVAVTGETVGLPRSTVIGPVSSVDLHNLSLLSSSTVIPLNIEFSPDTLMYSANVANDISSLTVTETVNDSNNTVTMSVYDAANQLMMGPIRLTSGIASEPIALFAGNNTIELQVTSPGGTIAKTYSVLVNRSYSNNGDLSGLTLSQGDLSPVFTSGTLNYSANVGNAVDSLHLTPTLADATATVTMSVYNQSSQLTLGPVSLTSGHASSAIPLQPGNNTIRLLVTAQDGSRHIYSVLVNRAYSSNGDLSGLMLSQGNLSPVFTSGTLHYSVNVGTAIDTINLTPTLADATATVTMSVYNQSNQLTLGPVLLNSGHASGAIPLQLGNNTIRLQVIAQDGTTINYSIVVNRARPASSYIPDNGLDIQINGEIVRQLVRVTNTYEGGKWILTLIPDQAQFISGFNQHSDYSEIVVPVTQDTDQVRLTLTGNEVQALHNKQVSLEIQTPMANYKLSAAQWMDILELLGNPVSGAELSIQIQLEQGSMETMQRMEQAAANGDFRVIVTPIHFTITATYHGQTILLDTFKTYVERNIPIPTGIDPSEVTTAVVLNPDGTVYHVPTKVMTIDGKSYAVVNSLTNSAYALISHSASYSDVTAAWQQSAVTNLASRMIIMGVDKTHFDPNADITRAEFVAMIVRALGLADSGTVSAFKDVQADDWYNVALAQAHSYGIINGYTDGTFRPNQTITREEAMAMIAQAMKIAGISTELDSADIDAILSRFADQHILSGWAREAVAAAIQKGLVKGYHNHLMPTDPITRAETAVIIERLLVNANLI
ncbi:cadherin-like beta sandwich domain-containing protein [Paenibacillus chungangensis]|uniref:Cadherin-like beta sandwich domain-containing protein n=1 Tax=Paenibacillus chungangensis TaxID=696535 RepID=A0ABW3HQJ6_9BACL